MKKKLNERGLPSVGGVSPGDTSNNLGQARRPWSLTGSSGGHSQSADSGFSSKPGRVNKGRDDDKYAYQVRFPENEEEPEEDEYDMSIRSKLSIDLRGRKPMPERKLTTDIDQLIENNEEFQLYLEDDRRGMLGNAWQSLKSGAKAIGRDLAVSFMASIPIAGLTVSVSSMILSIRNMSKKGEESTHWIEKYNTDRLSITGPEIDEMNDAVDGIVNELVHFITASITLLPDGETPAGEVVGFFGSVVKRIHGFSSVFTKGSIIGKGIRRKILIETLELIGDDKFDTFNSALPDGGINIDSAITSINIAESLLDIIENFEIVYSRANSELNQDYNTLSREYKEQLWITLESGEAVNQQFDIEVSDEQSYDPVSESKIRSLISQILSESEELIDEDLVETEDDDEVEEASVAGSIGGYVGPMASPANPKKFYKGMLKSYPGSHYVNDLPKSKI